MRHWSWYLLFCGLFAVGAHLLVRRRLYPEITLPCKLLMVSVVTTLEE